jgi:uncharacterized protein YlaI
MSNLEENLIGKCPFCKGEVTIDEVGREIKGKGFLKQEIMYICPHCRAVLGFSRGKFMS